MVDLLVDYTIRIVASEFKVKLGPEPIEISDVLMAFTGFGLVFLANGFLLWLLIRVAGGDWFRTDEKPQDVWKDGYSLLHVIDQD